MPELPEVEVTRAALKPYVAGNTVAGVAVYEGKLRWPVSPELADLLPGQTIRSVERRGKYLVLPCPAGGVLIHLGMTGHLRILHAAGEPGSHDRIDLIFENGVVVRLNDARRFGAVLWGGADPQAHRLLAGLGPEPLSDAFDGEYLYRVSRMRRTAIKQFIMDQGIVAGIGNIYANEALFHAGILPFTPSGGLSRKRCHGLARSIQGVLFSAITIGLAALDPPEANPKLGYFPITWSVYNRAGLPCPVCSAPIRDARSGQRSTYFCPTCQQ